MLQIIFEEKTVMSTSMLDATVRKRMDPTAQVGADGRETDRKPNCGSGGETSVFLLLSAAGPCLLPYPVDCRSVERA